MKNETLNLNKSQRKFLAREKARIRRQFFDLEKQEEEIKKSKERFLKKDVAPKSEKPAESSPIKAKPKPGPKIAKKSKTPAKTKANQSTAK